VLSEGGVEKKGKGGPDTYGKKEKQPARYEGGGNWSFIWKSTKHMSSRRPLHHWGTIEAFLTI